MRRGKDYISELANGRQIAKEVGELLDIDDFDYNCGGFALGIPLWYVPYVNEWGFDESKELDGYAEEHYYELFMSEGREYAKACTGRGRIMVNYMLRNPNLREVQTSKEIKNDEYLVLFRASGDDFHFIRRMNDGTWAHKMGSSKIKFIKNGEVEKAWHSSIHNYQGKVFLLAVKKEDKREPCIW